MQLGEERMGKDNLFLKSVTKMFDDAIEILDVEP